MVLSSDELDVFMEDYIDDSLSMDIYDFKFRNDCILKYDLKDKMSDIKAKSLIIGIEGYLFINVETQITPLADKIKDSKILIFHPKTENYYEDDEDYSEIISCINSFLDTIKKV